MMPWKAGASVKSFGQCPEVNEYDKLYQNKDLLQRA